MAANKKLTPLLAGRTVQAASQSDNHLSLTFTDGSTLGIKTGGEVTGAALNGRIVKSVRQSGAVMSLDFQDGTSARIMLAEATSSVMLRDKNNKMEYAD